MRLLGSVHGDKNGKISVARAAWGDFEDDPSLTDDGLQVDIPVSFSRPAPVPDAQSMVQTLQDENSDVGLMVDTEALEAAEKLEREARARLEGLEDQVESTRLELARLNDEIEMLKQSREDLSKSLHEETEMLLQQAKDAAEIKASEIVRDANEAREKAIVEGREEAAKLKKDTFAEAFSSGETQGHEAGFRAGFEAGKKQSAREAEGLLAALNQALDKSNSLLADIAKDSEGQIISLALAIAKKVIQREIMLDPKATADLIRSALKKVSHRKDFFIKVSPVDLDTLKAQESYIRQDLLQAQTFQIISDSRVEAGSCLIETEAGTVEASIAAQLAFIEEQLQGLSSNPG